MWAALTSDLKEFVSGVEDETTVVSTKLVQSVESLERLGATTGEDGEVLESGFEATGLVSNAADEVARRRCLVETYTEPLDESRPDVVAFLESFDLESKTEKIASLLGTSAIVKERFEQVCPEKVTYKEFWLRYFYRCNEKRVELEWQDNQETAKKARDAVISSGIASVTSMFGGAVKAVTKAVERNDKAAGDVVPASPFGFSSGGSMFGGARPPFVMNTAVDDDEEEEEEEEEAEEELGWGDEDSFDEDDEEAEKEEEEEEEEKDDAEEEIEFSGGAIDKLTQALAERDALHQTVELQAKELAALREGKESPAVSREVEELKMRLFEKDAELAAFKASGEDNEMDDKQAKLDFAKITSLEAAVEELKASMEKQAADMAKSKEDFEAQLAAQAKESVTKVAALESAKAALESQAMDNANGQLTAALQAAAAAKDECQALQTQLVDAQTQVASAERTCKEIETALADATSKLSTQQAAFEKRLQEEAAAFEAATAESASGFQQEMDALTIQLQTALTHLQVSNQKVVTLTTELAAAKEELHKATPDLSKIEDASNDTTSTGVQVAVHDDEGESAPVPTVPVSTSRPAEDGEPEEDWGDDW